MGETLTQFRDEARESLPIPLLILDEPLVRAVQERLAGHGLLDPPADGFLGPVSQWALAEFCRARDLAFAGALTPATAGALLDDDPVLPLRPGDDLAGRVIAAMLRRGDWVCRHSDCLTIAYVEGMDPHGDPTARRPDAFEDARLLLRVAPDGVPVLAGAWDATTAPGRPAVEQPAEPAGAPRIRRGQHKAWVIGRTAIGTEQEQEALVQVAPLPVTRDANRDFQRRRRRAERPLRRGPARRPERAARCRRRRGRGLPDRTRSGRSRRGHGAAALGRPVAGEHRLPLHDGRARRRGPAALPPRVMPPVRRGGASCPRRPRSRRHSPGRRRATPAPAATPRAAPGDSWPATRSPGPPGCPR